MLAGRGRKQVCLSQAFARGAFSIKERGDSRGVGLARIGAGSDPLGEAIDRRVQLT